MPPQLAAFMERHATGPESLPDCPTIHRTGVRFNPIYWRLFVAVMCCLTLSSCGGHELKGSISVVEQLGLNSTSRIGEDCTGTGGFNDIQAGAPVTVADEAGKILATGTLDSGKISALETCRFTFDLKDVPDAKFYQVEVAHRGKVTYSADDMSKAGWSVNLSLG